MKNKSPPQRHDAGPTAPGRQQNVSEPQQRGSDGRFVRSEGTRELVAQFKEAVETLMASQEPSDVYDMAREMCQSCLDTIERSPPEARTRNTEAFAAWMRALLEIGTEGPPQG